MGRKNIRILIAEDDPSLNTLLCDYLTILGYTITTTHDGKEAWTLLQQGGFDLCLLDVMMPRMDGITLATEIRKMNSTIPIIFLTARNLNEDRVRGFKTGGDDYITKPFNSEELALRIEAVLKRCGLIQEEERYEIGEYSFDAINMLLFSPAGSQPLTQKETALLRLLCRNKNNLLSREKALKEVWGDENYFAGRSMDVYITKLRKFLKDDPNVNIINVHGIGYRLEIKNSG